MGWGRVVRDSRELWETLMLEGFQAGLSWQIVLRKRNGFRKAFHQFDPAKVAKMTGRDVERLMQDPGIIRARAKIEATILGAKIFVEMEKAGEDLAGGPGRCTANRSGTLVLCLQKQRYPKRYRKP